MNYRSTRIYRDSYNKNRDQRIFLLIVSAISVLTFFYPTSLFSQQSISGVPLSVIHDLAKPDHFESMPEFSKLKASRNSEQEVSKLKKLEFAHIYHLAFTPENSGEWIILENGDRIWRMGITSRGAFSLNIIFGRFQLENDVKLYIYTPDQQHILGAFSDQNNSQAFILATEPLPGDSIIIELNVPSSVNSYGDLEVSKLGHDYINIFGSTFKNGLAITGSGACNIDINCDPGLAWQRENMPFAGFW
ncbi:MAG: hypothetical protein HC905_03635 [Bacteroidales bacterium]|nr:hypothetical protein [Bacteroidales bacterium]